MTSDHQPQETLQRRALGPTQVLFQSIASAGPAAGVATSLVFVMLYAGGSSPLAVFLGTIGILFVAISLGQMAKYIPSAGGMYSYTAQGLGKNFGFLAAWTVTLAEFVNVPVVFLGFLYITQANLVTHLKAPTWIWVPIAFVGIGIVTGLCIRGIKISTEVLTVLGVVEITVLVALAISLIVLAGHHNTLSVFAVHTGNKKGFGADFAGIIYCILAFIGFDAAAPLAEEALNPKRTIPRALVGSVVVTGIFFVLLTYAGVVYWGPTKIASFVSFNGGDPFDGVAKLAWGGAWIIVLLAILNSLYIGTIGATNAATRYQYSLGRIGILHPRLATVHHKFKTPWITILLQGGITLGLALILSPILGSPQDAFGFLATGVVLLYLVIYGLASISCLPYYWRHHRSEFNILLHGVIPVLAVLFMIPVFIASLGINFAGLGIFPITGPDKWAPILAGIWMLIGIILLPTLKGRWNAKFSQLGHVFVDDDAAKNSPNPEMPGVLD